MTKIRSLDVFDIKSFKSSIIPIDKQFFNLNDLVMYKGKRCCIVGKSFCAPGVRYDLLLDTGERCLYILGSSLNLVGGCDLRIIDTEEAQASS